MRTYNRVHCLSTNLNVNNCLGVYSIVCRWCKWVARMQKTRRNFHRKKSVLVLYYSFFERSPNLSKVFFKTGNFIFLTFFLGLKKSHSNSDSSRKMSNIAPKNSIIIWQIRLVFCVVVQFPVMGSPACTLSAWWYHPTHKITPFNDFVFTNWNLHNRGFLLVVPR